ncbi:MAG: 50S ribosomal protein L25 [Chloroflexi bacterium]|nr:50S ribosomal protein L25 [Chloroflexota bacterium]
MARLKVKATKRQVLGKQVKALRREGFTPANLYGRGQESVAIQIETPVLQKALARVGRTTLLDLQVGQGHAQVVLVKEVQIHPVYRNLIHVEFYQVDMAQKMRVAVPLAFLGKAPALDVSGALFLPNLNSIEVECLPADLPSRVEVDISGLMEINASIYVRDLALGTGVMAVADPDQVVAKIGLAKIVEEEAPKAEAAVAEAEAEAKPEEAAGEEAKTPGA